MTDSSTKKEIDAMMEDAFGESHTMEIVGALAQAFRLAEAFHQGTNSKNTGLGLALTGLKEATAGVDKAIGADRADREAMRRASTDGHLAFFGRCQAATPQERARAYSALEAALSLVESVLGVVQKAMLDRGEVGPLLAVAAMDSKHKREVPPGALPAGRALSQYLAGLMAVVGDADTPEPSSADLDDAFASVFGNPGGSGAED